MNSASKTSISDFKIERQLGKGSFSSVYLVTRIADQKIYALKSVTMDKLTKKEQQNSVNEVRILASVSHPNVIGYREAFWDDNNQTLNIVMEYADDGDLQTKIHQMKKNNGMFEEDIIWSYAIQMIEGLKALHDKKIMHRDLKSANIFLSKNNNKKICKIGDMNVSKVVKEKVLMTQTGTPYYASPEVWNDKPYSYKSDLWSIGCVIYELCALRPPFKGKDLDELYINVCKGKVERIKKVYSDKLWKMILMLLQVDVNKRVNCDQFLNHPMIIQKIKEMKMKDSEYYSLEENKNTKEGYLLNTINFKDLKEIKAQLPKTKNYGNNFENKKGNNYDYNYYFNKENYFNSFGNNNLLQENNKEYNKEYNNVINNNNHNYNINNNSNEIFRKINPSNMNNNSNKEINYNNNNYYNYINERINKLYHNNINNNNKKYNYNINNSNKNIINNNNYNYSNSHINIINDKSYLSKNYNDFLNNLRDNDILHTEENKKINNKLYEKEENKNKNYNLYDQILQTDFAVNDLLKRDNKKINKNSDLKFTYENLNTEEKIDYNEKIKKLKKEKNKILEKQKDMKNPKTKTIEDQITEYKNLFNKKIEPTEQKFNNYLSIINYYNENTNLNNNNNDNKINEYNTNNNLSNNKTEQKLLKTHGMTLSPNPHNKNIISSTSTRKSNNLEKEKMYKRINNKNIQKKDKTHLENKKSSKLSLNTKTPSYNNFNERAKTPTSQYINKKPSAKALRNKNKTISDKINFNYNNINNNHMNTNNAHNSLLNPIPKDYFSSLDKKDIINNVKSNINSLKTTSNSIKRINKPYLNINKKRNVGTDNHHHHQNIQQRQKSSLILKKNYNKNSNIYLNHNDLTNYDSSNIKNNNYKYTHKYINFDLSKDINDINLTCVEDNRNNKASLYKMAKITLDNDKDRNKMAINNDNKSIKPYNKKYSITLNSNNNNNRNIKNNKKNFANKVSDYNYLNHNNNQNQSYNQIMQYSKKLSARSNSYRITSNGSKNDYINKRRKLNNKYDLTETDEKIVNNLKLNTSKAKNSQIINYSLVNNGINFMNIGNNNFNSNDILNNLNLKYNINNSNLLDNKHYMNMENSSKTPQIFNNYYSINGVVTSSSPIKVINVFNN